MGSNGSRIEPGAERLSRLTVFFVSFLLIVSVIPLTPTAADLQGTDLIVAASSAPVTAIPTSVTGTDIAGALTQARSDWHAILPTADLSGVTASGADLGGLQLASTAGSSITVDLDAAGWGWSVSFPGESGHMSLVTVLRHELGHVLGLDHAGGLMNATLSPDEVRSVLASDAAPITPAPVETVSESVSTEDESETSTEPTPDPVTTDGGTEDPVPEAVGVLTPSATSVDAGTITLGESTTVSVDLSNTGAAVLVISGLSISGDAAFTTSASGMTLEPDEWATVSVDFVPTVTGEVSATLDVTSDGGDASVALFGVGVDPEPVVEEPVVDPEPAVEEPVVDPVLTLGASLSVTMWSTSAGIGTATVADGNVFDHTLRFNGAVAELVDALGVVDSLDTAGLSGIVLAGGNGDDTLTLNTPGSLAVSIAFEGGDGTDSVRVSDSAGTWRITGVNVGTYVASDGARFTFTNVENLNGAATADDIFEFDSGAGVTGSIDDGTGNLKVGIAGFVQVSGNYDFVFDASYLARVAGTDSDIFSSLLTLGGTSGSGFVGVEPLGIPVGVSGALGEFGLAIVTTSTSAWHVFEGTLLSPSVVGIVELELGIDSLQVMVNGEADNDTHLDLSGNPIEVPTGGTPVILDFSTSLVAASAPLELKIGANFFGAGTFTFGVTGPTPVDVATGLSGESDATVALEGLPVEAIDPGSTIARSADFSTIWNLPTRGLTLAATEVNIFLGSGFGWTDANGDGIIQEAELVASASGFLATGIDIGLVMMSPTATGNWAFDVSHRPTFLALMADASFLGLVNIPELELSASGISVEVNRGSVWADAPDETQAAVVDWELSFDAGFNIPTGGTSVNLAFAGTPLIGISADKVLLRISDFVYITGAFSVRVGPIAPVDVRSGLSVLTAVHKPTLFTKVFEGIPKSSDEPIDGTLARSPGGEWIWNLPVETLQFGMTDVDVFVGYTDSLNTAAADGDLTVEELKEENAIGLFLDEIVVGMVLMDPLPVSEGFDAAGLRFLSLEANADNVTMLGIPEITFEAAGIEVQINGGTFDPEKWPGVRGSNPPPVVDFLASFPGNPTEPDGYRVETGRDAAPVYLVFDGPILGASCERANIQISQFVYITGSVAFAKGPVETVQLADSLVDTAVIDELIEKIVVETGLTPDQKATLEAIIGLTEKELQFLTIGGYQVHAFVGLGGPYWVDADDGGVYDNGLIDRYTSGRRAGQIVDEEISPNADGLVLDNFTFGLAYMSPTNAIDPSRYLALHASASKVAFVGIEDLVAVTDNVLVELNISTPLLLGVSILPVVDFCDEWTGGTSSSCAGFGVRTGAKDPLTGEDITVDLTTDEYLIRAKVGYLELDYFGLVTLVGSFALVLGPTEKVTLVNPDGTSGKDTVMSMTFGASDVFGFIGWDGPYFVDGNENKHIDVDLSGDPILGEVNPDAIGIALSDLDLGIFFGLSTTPQSPAAYLALSFSVDSLSFVGLDFLAANAMLDMRVNVGAGFSPGAVIDFKESFLDDRSTCVRGPPDIDCNDGYRVDTGDPDNPILIDFDEFLVNIEIAGEITVTYGAATPTPTPIVSMLGTFFLEIDGSSFKILTTAALRLGPDIGSTSTALVGLSALGVFVITGAGIAADLDVDVHLGVPGLGGAFSARLLINTTGVDQEVELPTRIIGFLEDSSSPLADDLLARLVPCESGSVECYVIDARVPDLMDAGTVLALLEGSGTVRYGDAGPYVVALLRGEFHFLEVATATGLAGISISDDQFAIIYNLAFSLGPDAISIDFEVSGTMSISSDGLYLNVGVELDMNITSLFEVDVDGFLTIDTTGSVDIFELHMSGDLTIARVLTLNSGFTIEVGKWGPDTWRFELDAGASLGPVSFDIDGWLQSDGQFDITVGGYLQFGIDGFGIRGDIKGTVSLTKSGTAFDYQPGDEYRLKVELTGMLIVTIAGIDLASASLTMGGIATLGGSKATLRLYAEGCVYVGVGRVCCWGVCVNLGVDVCLGGTIATVTIPISILPEGPPQLATLLPGGMLELNVGDRHGNRTVATSTIAESYTLTQVGAGRVLVQAFGYSEVYSGVNSVHGDFGTGDDTLFLYSGFTLPVTAIGGIGHDSFATDGSGSVTFEGGGGNDILIGGSGIDVLRGQANNDYLDGRGGVDTLSGGDGNDVVFGTVAHMTGETPSGGDGNDVFEVRGTTSADIFTLTNQMSSLKIAQTGVGSVLADGFEDVLLIPAEGADTVNLIGNLTPTGLETFTVSLVEGTPSIDRVTVTLLATDDTVTLSGASVLSVATNQRSASGAIFAAPTVSVPTSTIDWMGRQTSVISAADSSDLITVRTLAGIDNVLIPSLVANARIETGDGSDRIAVGSNAAAETNTGGTLESINALLTVVGGGGTDHLTLDDSGETSGQAGTLTDDLLTGYGLTGGGIAYSNISTLDISLGLGGDTLSVLSTAGGTTTYVDAGPGADAVHVSSDAPNDLGTLHGLAGPLVLVGSGGTDSLFISEAGNSVGGNGTLSATALTGFGTAGIGYEAFEVLEVYLGTGADSITVDSTHSGTTLIVGGDDADTFDIRSIAGRTEVHGADGDDTFRIGTVMPTLGGLLDEIDALLVIDGGAGIDNATIDDSGDTDDNLGTLTQTTLIGLGMGAGVSQTGGINYYGFGANEEITILLGSGNDRFNARGTIASTRLETRDGDDVVYVSDSADLGGLATALAVADGDLAVLNDLVLHGATTVDGLTFYGSLDLIIGALDIETGRGSNTLAVSDKADPDPDTNVTITDASIIGLAPAVISYSATNGDLAGQGTWALLHDGGLFGRGITIYGGGGGNTFTITSVLGSDMTPSPFSATVTSLFAGAGVDSVDISVADGAARMLVIRGEDGDDAISGAPVGLAESTLPLTIFGDDGYDTLTGGNNDDQIFGDDARVYFRVPAGAIGWDIVLGGDPSVGDLVHPLTGVVPAADADFLTPEVLLTGATIIGVSGAGTTLLTGDVIDGRDGNDLIFGGAGADVAYGGRGNDLMFGDFGWVGGSYDATALPLSMPIAGHPFEFISTDVTDTNAASDILHGGAGADIILGQQGADMIFGGADDDDLFGGHNVSGGHDTGDAIDAGSGHDVIVGDSAVILRTGSDTTVLVRALISGLLYGGVTSTHQGNPTGVEARFIWLLDHAEDTASNLFGADVIAGGADDDVIFGQLGNDTIHGDGMVTGAGDGVEAAVTTATDGDDYIEGGGGDDVIYGGLGQDDIIGGSSDLFGLTAPAMRPDGVDMIYGGNGDAADRNDEGDLLENGHARDADVILGDNGRILRVVGTSGIDSGAFLRFSYDTYGIDTVIPRSVMFLDYSPYGGAEYWSTEPPIHPSAPELIPGSRTNIGDGDFIHGEAGDDVIHGMTGNDALFGDAQDDDIYGEEGYDWISGGAGDDGILGDDGLLLTSRNGTAEALYAIAATTERIISTPSHRQSAIINVEGELAKAADLEPFWIGHNDVIYGGLGNDFIHAGMGDDAVSGAEALGFYYVDDPLALLASLYEAGNVLQYNFRAGSNEFAYFDRYDPLRKVHLRTVPVSGEFLEDGSGNRIDFLLNFEARITPSDPYSVIDDGKDTIFGDGGNDWIVGGTGHDRMFGGWGDDLLQVDDDLDSTVGSGDDDANNIPDVSTSAVTFADFAYGGAGRDILIANTAADRLIDWAGQSNSYVVPFRSQGAPTISRSPSRHIFGYLYALSAASGIDLTRGDATRNGEPYGELGLVTQKDDDWKAQTGKSSNTPKGKDKKTKVSGVEAAALFAQEAGNQTVSPHDAPEPDVVSRHPGDADVDLTDTPTKLGRGRGRQRLWAV